MTVGELITWLTAESVALPSGLDTQVLVGVDDDIESTASIYTRVDIAAFEIPGRGMPALWVRGVARATGTPSPR